jgi:hypothetical protein
MMKKLIALAFCAAFGLTSFSALAEEDHHHYYHHHYYHHDYHHHDHHMWRRLSGESPQRFSPTEPDDRQPSNSSLRTGTAGSEVEETAVTRRALFQKKIQQERQTNNVLVPSGVHLMFRIPPQYKKHLSYSKSI